MHSSLLPGSCQITVKGSTSVSHYRALHHVLTYTSQNESDAETVILNSIRGGMLNVASVGEQRGKSVKIFLTENGQYENTDQAVTTEGGPAITLVPSSQLFSVISLLISEGYFCPSTPFCVENGKHTYNFRSEAFPRDSFTIVVLLFPECFANCSSVLEKLALGEETSNFSGDTAQSQASRTSSVPRASPGSQHSLSCDLNELAAIRQEVAVNYLMSLNETLHQIKVLETEIQGNRNAEESDGLKVNDKSDQSNPAPEMCMLESLNNELERIKLVLLLCLCITSSSEINPSLSFSLFQQISHGEFFGPFESQHRPADRNCQKEWYEAYTIKIRETYKKLHETDAMPDTFDHHLAEIVSRVQKSVKTLSIDPHLVLHRPHDGHPGVGLTYYRPTPVMPHMPIQPGEISFTFPSCGLEINCCETALYDFLNRCMKRHFTPNELRTEMDFVRGIAEATSTSAVSMTLCFFARTAENLRKILEKNPEILSFMVLSWKECGNKEKTPWSDFNFSYEVVDVILFGTPFSVSVGKFLRYLVQEDFIDQELILRWLERCCATAESSPSQFTSGFFALVDFIITRFSLELPQSIAQSLNELRVKAH